VFATSVAAQSAEEARSLWNLVTFVNAKIKRKIRSTKRMIIPETAITKSRLCYPVYPDIYFSFSLLFPQRRKRSCVFLPRAFSAAFVFQVSVLQIYRDTSNCKKYSPVTEKEHICSNGCSDREGCIMAVWGTVATKFAPVSAIESNSLGTHFITGVHYLCCHSPCVPKYLERL